MEEKKSYKADLEHRRPYVFAIALAAVTLVFVGVLFIPYKSIAHMADDMFDDYSMDLELKANDQDDMISAAMPEKTVVQKVGEQIKKVDNSTELPPERLETPVVDADAETATKVEEEQEQPPINLNGDDEEKLRIVEELPEYPGGMVEFMKWLTATLKYPDAALKRRMHGKVMISFIVEKDGTLTSLKVIKSAGKMFDDEALRVARLMPQWKPGKADGKPCRSMIAIPIVFEL